MSKQWHTCGLCGNVCGNHGKSYLKVCHPCANSGERAVSALAGLKPEHVGELVEMVDKLSTSLDNYHAELCCEPPEECADHALLVRAVDLLAKVKT